MRTKRIGNANAANTTGKQRRVFSSWFLSYMAVLLLSAAVVFAIYTLMASSITEQITGINREILAGAKTEIESNIDTMKNTAIETSLDPNIVEIAFHHREEILKMVSALRTIVSGLKRSNAAVPEISNISIYLNKPGLEIGPQGVDTEETKLSDNSVITITHPILPGREGPGIGYIYISMDNRYLARYLAGLEEVTKGRILLCAPDLTPLLPAKGTSPVPLSLIASKEDTGGEVLFPLKIKGNESRYIVDSIEIRKGGLRLLSIVPVKVYLGPLTAIRRAALALFMFMIAAGVLLSFHLTRRNYRPLEELLLQIVKQNKRGLRRSGERGPRAKGNEFDYISDSISTVYDEKEKLFTTIQSQGGEMKNAYLAALLRGRGTPVNASSGLKELLRIPDNFPRHRLCLFDFEGSSEKNALLLPYLVQREAAASGSEERISAEPVEIDGRAAFLFIYREQSDDGAVLLEILSLHDRLKTKHGISAACVIGRPGKGKKNISRNYTECLEALEYRYIYGPGSVIFSEKVGTGTPSGIDFGEEEGKLLRAIRSGKNDDAETVLEKILGNSEASSAPSFSPEPADPRWSKYVVYNTVGMIIKAARALSGGAPSDGEKLIMDEIVRGGEEIFKLNSFPEVRLHLKSMVKSACSYFASRKKSHNEELNTGILDYVEAHLKEINLCNTMIADNFTMNPKYLSRFFREQNGINLTDHINSRRLEAAKELLRKGVTVKEISEKVGYGHSVTFIRVFKKMEGMTPGKYREWFLSPNSSTPLPDPLVKP